MEEHLLQEGYVIIHILLCASLLSDTIITSQGLFFAVRSFIDESEYCSQIGLERGLEGKTFIVQVSECQPGNINNMWLLYN